MTASSSGPALATLLRRLLDTPPDVLDPPRQGASGQVATAALVADVIALHGGRASREELQSFVDARPAAANRLTLTAIAAWLLADEAFLRQPIAQATLVQALSAAVSELAQQNDAHHYVHDAERREELARTLLGRVGLLPQGETPAQAQDRLSSISGVERQRLLQASRAAEARAREIRETLARKAAEESADKWTRE